jgi:hypothetical protein
MRHRCATVLAVAGLALPRPVHAQFTDPGTYANAPVGVNQAELDYGYAHADASIDTSLVVGGARFVLNQGVANYTHNFAFLGNLAWLKASVPFASLSGSVSGTGISGSVTGLGDASVQLATLLRGGTALSAEAFDAYEPTTTWGLSLAVTGPTGEYHEDKLLNLGSHRWSFRPELAFTYPFGRERDWEFDAYVNVSFFTDNTRYHGVEVLRQEPLPGIEAHLSHTFSPKFWASLDSRYAYRGDTFVDDVDQHETQDNLVVGTEAGWSPTEQSSWVLVLAKALVHRNAPAFTGAVLKYVYSW